MKNYPFPSFSTCPLDLLIFEIRNLLSLPSGDLFPLAYYQNIMLVYVEAYWSILFYITAKYSALRFFYGHPPETSNTERRLFA